MLAHNAARVFAGGARFGTKAGRPGADLDRQLVGVERFVAIKAGQLDLGRGRQPQVGALQMKHVRGEFRQLPDAGKRSRVHQKRRKIFRVAVRGCARRERNSPAPFPAARPGRDRARNAPPRSLRLAPNPGCRRVRRLPNAASARNRISEGCPSGEPPRCTGHRGPAEPTACGRFGTDSMKSCNLRVQAGDLLIARA